MKRRLFFSIFAILPVLAGCSHVKKESKPKENPAIAADTEANLRQRFVDRRAAELVTQGVAAEAARAQATAEFNARYSYTGSPKK